MEQQDQFTDKEDNLSSTLSPGGKKGGLPSILSSVRPALFVFLFYPYSPC
jgi:hypothetical protein